MADLPHEIHNRAALECAAIILREIPDLEGRMVALESVISGVLGMMHLPSAALGIALDLLRDGAGDRLNTRAYTESGQ